MAIEFSILNLINTEVLDDQMAECLAIVQTVLLRAYLTALNNGYRLKGNSDFHTRIYQNNTAPQQLNIEVGVRTGLVFMDRIYLALDLQRRTIWFEGDEYPNDSATLAPKLATTIKERC